MYATAQFRVLRDAANHVYGPTRWPISPRPTLLHASTGRPRTDVDDPHTLIKDLDLHLSARASLVGSRVHAPVWHCILTRDPGARRLADSEWTHIARRIVAAAGFDDPTQQSPGCPWIAVRGRGGHEVHLLASAARRNGTSPPLPGTNARAFGEVHAVTFELHAQDTFAPTSLASLGDAASLVVVRAHGSGVITAEGGDTRARAILQRHGFEPERSWMRTRYGIETGPRAACAVWAARELGAHDYDVRLDAALTTAARPGGQTRRSATRPVNTATALAATTPCRTAGAKPTPVSSATPPPGNDPRRGR